MPCGKCTEVLDRKEHVDLEKYEDTANIFIKKNLLQHLGTCSVLGATKIESIYGLFRVQE